jgi:hypothetical protein
LKIGNRVQQLRSAPTPAQVDQTPLQQVGAQARFVERNPRQPRAAGREGTERAQIGRQAANDRFAWGDEYTTAQIQALLARAGHQDVIGCERGELLALDRDQVLDQQSPELQVPFRGSILQRHIPMGLEHPGQYLGQLANGKGLGWGQTSSQANDLGS